MAEISDAFDQAFRDYVTEGVPASGVNQVSKAECRAIGPIIEAWIADQIAAGLATLTPPGPSGPYVMPTFSAVGSAAGGVSSADAPWPSLLAGDIALLSAASYHDSSTPADFVRPSGWTQISTSIVEGTSRAALYWKRCDGTESGTQHVACSGTLGGQLFGAVISTWRGCVDNGDPYEAMDTNHGASASMTSRSVTTLGPERRVVQIYSIGLYQSSDPDVGYTEVYDAGAGSGANIEFSASAMGMTAAGTAAAESRSVTYSRPWAAFSLALVPST